MMRRTIIHLVWIISIIIALPCFGNDSKLQLSPEENSWLSKNKTVRIRIGNAPPFMFTEGKIQGIAIDYLTQIFTQYGITIKYIRPSEVTWPQALEYMKQHEMVDMVPTAKITDERKKNMIFTNEYIFSPWVIFTRADSDFISSIEDLNGKTVSVEEGYAIQQKLKHDYPGITLKVASARLKNYTEIPIRDLSTGLADAYIGNLLSTTYIIQTKGYTNIKVAAPTPFENHNQAMAIRSDWPELASIINKALSAMTPNEHAAIRNKWLSMRYEYGIHKTEVIIWLLSVAGVASVIVGFILFWNRRLKVEANSRKKAETALRKSEKRFRAIFEQSPLGIALINSRTGQFLQVNQKYCDITGYSEEVMIELGFQDLTHPDDLKEDLDNMEKLKKNEITSFTMEKRYLRKDGDVKWVLLTVVPLWGEETTLNLHMAIVNDISESKKADEEKMRFEFQLRQSQKMEAIGTLAGGVAHEINNPINGIMNYAQLVEDNIGDGNPLKEYASEIINETNRVATIVRNLLTFARDERENHSPARLKDIVGNTMSLIQTVFKRDQIILEINISEDLPLILCRSQQIQQVIMNLVTNARDALNAKYEEFNENKKILISSTLFEKNGRRWIRTTVEDLGIGIAPEVRQRMFDPFYTTKDRSLGTGLGLSISYSIVKDHHGKLSFESEPGQYTQSHMDLPVDNGWNLEKNAKS